MYFRSNVRHLLLMIAGVFFAILPSYAQESAAAKTVSVHMVVTAETNGNKPVPSLRREDVIVKRGKDRLQVTDFVPARGDHAALQLFILIDDTCDTSLGGLLDDVRAFINVQPATTLIGIGYMQNAGVTIVQELTSDHSAAAKALRLPLGSVGVSNSPYLSFISLLKRWPESKIRRQVIIVSDGIDRMRSSGHDAHTKSSTSSRSGFGTGSQAMATMSPDVGSASDAGQRSGVMVHTIYAQGAGHAGRNQYTASVGQNSLGKLSEETGGESFIVGFQNPVSFKPYLDEVQTVLDNQYYLVFLATPGKKAGLQSVKISTEVPDAEIDGADSVWVPAAK